MTVDHNTIIDINKLALDFHVSNVERIQKLCDPLKHLGITLFGYLKMFDDSTYLHICNHDTWPRYYIQNIHDSGKIFSTIVASIDSEVTSLIWPDETTDHLLLALKNLNICHGITFYKRTGNFIESWNFAAGPDNPQIHELYMKYKALLWKFVEYFNEQAADLIDHSDRRRRGVYKNGNNIAPAKKTLIQNNIGKFLEGIKTKQYLIKCNQNFAFISERERQCLELIARGLTQSDQMGLPPHLIERYLDQVKFKLGITCKNELLSALESSHFE